MLLSPLREQDLAPSLGLQPAARSREAWGHITLRGREARSTPRFQLIKTKRECKLIAELNGVKQSLIWHVNRKRTAILSLTLMT